MCCCLKLHVKQFTGEKVFFRPKTVFFPYRIQPLIHLVPVHERCVSIKR